MASSEIPPRGRYRVSQEMLSRGLRVTGVQRGDLEGLYPAVFVDGQGAHVRDADGNSYIDLTSATGAAILGYRFKSVDDAVIRQLETAGNVFLTRMSEQRIHLAEKLVELVPCAERVTFHKTGSCATTAAIRIARIATGRQIVLTSGYHGWHDWHLSMFDAYRMPDPTHLNFGYDLNLLESLLAAHAGNVACIIITPEPNFFPDAYFRELREISLRHGVLLIFDEVACGFRFALGGFQKYCGVIPDMATFGKGLANCYSIAAVVGPTDLMVKGTLNTHLWSTYEAEATGFAAALATIDVFERDNAIDHMSKMGARLIAGLRDCFRKAGVVADIRKHPTMFHIIFDNGQLHDAWALEALERGVVLSRYDYNLPPFSLTEDDVDEALRRLDAALDACRPRFAAEFGRPASMTVSRATLEARTLNEFGGTMDYRKVVPRAEGTMIPAQ